MLFGKRKLRKAIESRDLNRLSFLLDRSPRLANLLASSEQDRPLHLVLAGGSWRIMTSVMETDNSQTPVESQWLE